MSTEEPAAVPPVEEKTDPKEEAAAAETTATPAVVAEEAAPAMETVPSVAADTNGDAKVATAAKSQEKVDDVAKENAGKIQDAAENAASSNHIMIGNRRIPMIDTNFIKLRGVPYTASEDMLRNFLVGVTVMDIIFVKLPDGRCSGEAVVEVQDAESVKTAVKLHRNDLNGRYIEVFTVALKEKRVLTRRGVIPLDNRLVKLKGLPFTAMPDEVTAFLKGVGVEDVLFVRRPDGKMSGDAFVVLTSKLEMDKALEYNKQHMGQRYVNVIRGRPMELDQALGQGLTCPSPNAPPLAPSPGRFGGGGGGPGVPPPGPGFARGPPPRYNDYGGNDVGPMRGGFNGDGGHRAEPYPYPSPRGGGGPMPMPMAGGFGGGGDGVNPTIVFMRGLPFDVDAPQVRRFFPGLQIVDVKIGLNEQSRPSGDGSVEFTTLAEAREALAHNREKMGPRYIELFPSHQMPPQMRRQKMRSIGGGGMEPTARIPSGAPPPSSLNGYGAQGWGAGAGVGGGAGSGYQGSFASPARNPATFGPGGGYQSQNESPYPANAAAYSRGGADNAPAYSRGAGYESKGFGQSPPQGTPAYARGGEQWKQGGYQQGQGAYQQGGYQTQQRW